MTTIVFAGPSLAPDERGAFSQVEWRPPAEAGDLLGLTPEPGLTLCLIDGYFDHRPAVRHKELLLLLSEGVRIYGASSIGALRAAEMAPFGMIGIGAIYQAYAEGRIVGDDEVALIHATEDWGWRPLSLPLVDVRATLCRALRERVVEAAQARALLEEAAAIHYVDRNWPLVLERAPAGDRFRSWLAVHKVNLKQIDAIDCLKAALSEPASERTRPPAVPTVFLRSLARECGVSLDGRL